MVGQDFLILWTVFQRNLFQKILIPHRHRLCHHPRLQHVNLVRSISPRTTLLSLHLLAIHAETKSLSRRTSQSLVAVHNPQRRRSSGNIEIASSTSPLPPRKASASANTGTMSKSPLPPRKASTASASKAKSPTSSPSTARKAAAVSKGSMKSIAVYSGLVFMLSFILYSTCINEAGRRRCACRHTTQIGLLFERSTSSKP
jgi:hypothetical protein